MNLEKKVPARRKGIWNDHGRTYFSRETERRFYFVATICILIAGVLFKAGWL